jgi:hypothetical protein
VSSLTLLLTNILQLTQAQLQLFVKLMLNFAGLRPNFVHNNIKGYLMTVMLNGAE